MKTPSSLALLLPLALFPAHAPAQTTFADGERCAGPVYERTEVSRPARVTHKPVPEFTDEARKHNVCGTVRLRAVLCRTGRVTDVEVVEGLPGGMTESAAKALKAARFMPAFRDGRPASQRATFEYNFNLDSDCGQSDLHAPRTSRPGALVEDVQVEGNRRWRDETIMGHLKTRPGDPYNPEQVQRDLQALLALPFFDKTETRVTTADGVRGGVVVVFTVRELPIIRDITFNGLRSLSEDDALKALRERGTGVSKEGVYDPAKVRAAERVIRELLAERGRPNAFVVAFVEEISPQSVALGFHVNEGSRRVEPEQDREEEPWWVGPIPLWRKPPALAPHPKRV